PCRLPPHRRSFPTRRSADLFLAPIRDDRDHCAGKGRRRGRTAHRFSVKSRNQMPARSVHIPAAPAAVMAEAEESFTITFATPFADRKSTRLYSSHAEISYGV